MALKAMIVALKASFVCFMIYIFVCFMIYAMLSLLYFFHFFFHSSDGTVFLTAGWVAASLGAWAASGGWGAGGGLSTVYDR